jgi:hypothetical protein
MHGRQQIRDAAIQAITGLALTGARVFAGQIYPLQEAELPGICVYVNEESSQLVTRTTMSRDLSLKIEIYVKSNDDFDAILDDIASDIEVAIASNIALNALVKDIHPSGLQKDLIKDGEKPIGIAVMSFYCSYFTAHNNPDIIR